MSATTRRILRTCLAAGLALTMAAGMSGCGKDGEETTVGHWVINHPDSWQEVTPLGKPWTAAYKVEDMEVQVAGEFSDDPTPLAALGRLDLPATLKLEGYETVRTDDVTIDDATGAMVRYYTYKADGQTRNGVWIVASQFPYPASAVISISGKTLDEEAVQDLLDDLTFVKNSKSGPSQDPDSPGTVNG